MHADFTPDYASLRRYVRWIVEQGAIGLTINADTGEGAHLSIPERLRVTEVVKDEAGSGVTVVSGLIASYTAQAVDIAKQLKSAGADALLVFGIPAFQGLPLPPELPYGYFAAIGEVGLPLVAFNLTPALGGVVFGPDVIARLVDVPALAALKEASFDAKAFVESRNAIRGAGRPIAFLSGCDNFIYESFVLGVDGCLLGYAGLAPRLTKQVLDLVHAHRFAEAEQINREMMQPLAEVMFGAPARNSRTRIKEGLVMLGIIPSAAVRPPMLALDDVERSAMRDAMLRAGLL
jgi:4-hydroxy-tetrahydrodipicolinate synthase